MIPITAFLIPPATIRVAFPYDAATVATVKALPGSAFVKDGKYWTLPVSGLDALIAACGEGLAVHPDVLAAKQADEERRVRVFVDNLHAAGISLRLENGRVIGYGGAYCADPWQIAIDARAETIIAMGLQHSHAPAPTHAR